MTCCSIEGSAGNAGQATVEAAVLLPTVLLLLGMLAQPVCLAYTRSAMRSAAAECARALVSCASGTDEVEAFALRRLEAVPEVPLFHVGGADDWSIELGRGDRDMTVSISGHARPLPLFLGVASAFAETDGRGIVLRVEVSERLRGDWLGGDYDEWTRMWE